MKTAISVPEDIFQKAENLARKAKKSRSQVYVEALREYVARHSPEEVTEAIDRVVAELGEAGDGFAEEASRRILEQVEW